MFRVCFKCFRRAMAYQPPEVWLKFICLYPENLTDKEVECAYHLSNPKSADSEIVYEVLNILDAEREAKRETK